MLLFFKCLTTCYIYPDTKRSGVQTLSKSQMFYPVTSKLISKKHPIQKRCSEKRLVFFRLKNNCFYFN